MAICQSDSIKLRWIFSFKNKNIFSRNATVKHFMKLYKCWLFVLYRPLLNRYMYVIKTNERLETFLSATRQGIHTISQNSEFRVKIDRYTSICITFGTRSDLFNGRSIRVLYCTVLYCTVLYCTIFVGIPSFCSSSTR